MSQGDVAKRRAALIEEARARFAGVVRSVETQEYDPAENAGEAIGRAGELVPFLADELAAAESERAALQDKVGRVRALPEKWWHQRGDFLLPEVVLISRRECAAELSAALSDEPELDAAAAVVIEGRRYKAEHGTE